MTCDNLQVIIHVAMSNLPYTLRQLEVFAALSDTLSFRRCAETLNVSQASVSNQIKALELQLGLRLFERPSGKPPSLTPEGLAFLSDLKVFQLAAERLAAHRRDTLTDWAQSSFRIFIAVGLMDRYIKPKLEWFIAQNPMIACEFVAQHPRLSPGNVIESGQYDFALYHTQDEAVAPTGHAILARVRSGLLGHRRFLAGKSLPLSAEEVSALPIILPPIDSALRKSVLAALSDKDVIPRNVIGHTQYYEVMARMIEAGTGVAPLTMALLDPEKRKDIMSILPLTNWMLVWYRKPGLPEGPALIIENFIKSAILEDPDYVTVADLVS